MRKVTNLEKTFAVVTLLAAVLLSFSIVVWVLKERTLMTEGLPSALLLVVMSLMPSIELYRERQIKPFGFTARSILLLMADVMFSKGQAFASIYWEIAAVAIALLFILYAPRILELVKGDRST